MCVSVSLSLSHSHSHTHTRDKSEKGAGEMAQLVPAVQAWGPQIRF